MNRMTNRQVWCDDIQPIENLCFEPVERSYRNVVVIRIIIVYILLMACALLIPLMWEQWLPMLIVDCVLAVAFVVNVALAHKIYNFKGRMHFAKGHILPHGIFSLRSPRFLSARFSR